MLRSLPGWCLAAFVLITPATAEEAPNYADLRGQMVATIELQSVLIHRETGVEIPETAILEAMSRVPRHRFVPDELAPLAYYDTPLPVGHEQNIAQPYLVALMTQLAAVRAGDRVYESGTGAGYHAAVLAELGASVFSVEIAMPLAERASGLLAELGYHQISVRVADGYDGWPDQAPFNAMIIKEAVVDVPPGLLAQLAPGGRMVVPIGPPDGEQFLTVIEKAADGAVERRKVLPVRFSPFQGGQRT